MRMMLSCQCACCPAAAPDAAPAAAPTTCYCHVFKEHELLEKESEFQLMRVYKWPGLYSRTDLPSYVCRHCAADEAILASEQLLMCRWWSDPSEYNTNKIPTCFISNLWALNFHAIWYRNLSADERGNKSSIISTIPNLIYNSCFCFQIMKAGLQDIIMAGENNRLVIGIGYLYSQPIVYNTVIPFVAI